MGATASSLYAGGRLKPTLIVVPNLAGQNSDGDTSGRTPTGAGTSWRCCRWSTPSIRPGRRSRRAPAEGSPGSRWRLRGGRRRPSSSQSVLDDRELVGLFQPDADRALRRRVEEAHSRHKPRGLRPTNAQGAGKAPDPSAALREPNRGIRGRTGPVRQDVRSLGVSLKTKVFPGDHDFDLWAAHMGLALQFADRHLTPAGGPCPPSSPVSCSLSVRRWRRAPDSSASR